MISVMEVEKRKNKRVTREEEEEEEEEKDCEKVKKLKLKGMEEEGSGVPTEEEVEEFYSILRRMKVVVKYFDDKGRGCGRDWKEALEKPVLTVDHGEENVAAGDADNMRNKKNKKEKGISGEVLTNQQGFDLNAVAPEAAESGGA